MHCIVCGLITTKFSPYAGRNIPVSVPGCHVDEMMPKCLQSEVDVGVRLAQQSHLSPPCDGLKTKMKQTEM